MKQVDTLHIRFMFSVNILPKLMMDVENAITAETIKEQNIDNINTSLEKENEQLKKELTRVRKIADRIHQENEMLRKSNKELRRKTDILRNIQKKTDEGILKTFNKDQKKAIYRKNFQGVQ